MIRLPTLLISIGLLGVPVMDEYPVAAALAQSGARPVGHAEFCEANPSLCRVNAATAPFPITNADLRVIAEINTAVNHAIIYAPRPATDPWDIEPAIGDCEDFVATKISRLVNAGVPRQDIRAAVVITETDETHLVLLLRTPAGYLVLDNRRDAIVLAFDTPYRFVSVEWVWGEGYSHWIVPEGMPR